MLYKLPVRKFFECYSIFLLLFFFLLLNLNTMRINLMNLFASRSYGEIVKRQFVFFFFRLNEFFLFIFSMETFGKNYLTIL